MKKKAKKIVRKAAPAKTTAPANKSGITPLGDRVLVRPIARQIEEEKTSFGLLIPATVAEKENSELPDKGIVVAVGAGKRGDDNVLIPVSVKVGNTVLFSASYTSKKIKISGVEHYLVQEEEILAVLD